jgi:hypothetical protein
MQFMFLLLHLQDMLIYSCGDVFVMNYYMKLHFRVVYGGGVFTCIGGKCTV